MHRLILLVAVAFSLWYWWQKAKSLPPEQRRSYYWRSTFWVVLGVSLALVASGRMHWVGAGLAALVPVIKTLLTVGVRTLPFLKLWQQNNGPSRFRTAWLAIELNFATGHMDGEILQGDLAGKQLSELSEEQLQNLAEVLKSQHRESWLLLQAYLVRRGRQGSFGGEQHAGGKESISPVSTDEAWQILGLEPGASKEEIIRAHKRLIQKLHPDRGGSDYLAAKINAAKDLLTK